MPCKRPGGCYDRRNVILVHISSRSRSPAGRLNPFLLQDLPHYQPARGQAEESELILYIGRWVLNKATRQMAEWVERLGPAAPPTISINLSRKQFAQSNLAEQVRAAAENSGLPASRIQRRFPQVGNSMNEFAD